MYAKCGSMEDSRRVFDSILHPNVMSLMLGSDLREDASQAVGLQAKLQDAAKACSSLTAKEDEKARSLSSSLGKWTARQSLGLSLLLPRPPSDMYSKCGSMVDARMVFESMPRRDVVLWTSLIQGFVDNGESELALVFFEDMKLSGCCPSSRTCVAALAACASSAMREEAVDVDGKLVKRKSLETGVAIHGEASNNRCCEDVFVGNTLIDMYAKCEKLEEARKVFDGMVGRCEWRHVRATCSVRRWKASANPEPRKGDGDSFSRREVWTLRAQICREQLGGHHLRPSWKESRLSFTGVGWKTIKLWGVNFYRKCGVMSAAEHLFGSLAVRDIVAWNALITGFGQQGDTSRVFEAFREMREDGVRANAITFVSVITACSHGGIVERGREFFQAMDPDSGIVCGIHHYSSLVDLIDENDSAAYVLMASIYRSAGLWEDHDKLKTIQEAALKADKKSSLHQAVTRW
ncbi:putative pentatricopeptide repeat-containing protein At5g52630 [Selaginella moellendorffii]|uniref:putative pentatricopeptide repeat-containing protein At5g52630 n=1 Tax=Selaginella moellendorffii TaxID=88036 RepID=UPI000D1CFB78|nr:putative pentatricopeptide repeat-containing protein At5g52630 [Selaginella moellendorffii]|eukprot:XP_024542069.1 putative pentatricopeptide repeat-containing protein At5g52630 [Selaginella moellendorffii]